jgi:hypothetical protein
MKDAGREGVERGAPEVERQLGRLAAAPVPEGMRQRVLARAEQARRDAALTPGLRRLAVASSIVLLAVVAVGPLIGRREAARLSALLDGRSRGPAAEALAPELAEVLAGDENTAERLAKLQVLAASAARAVRPIPIFEVRERLKGWLNDEDPEGPD